METIKLIFNLFSFFSKKRKLQVYGILFLMIISGISEAALVSLFLTFLNAITNINKLFYSSNFEYINSFFGINNPNQLKALLGIFFIIMIIISSSSRLLTFWATYRFSSIIGTEFSYKSFKNKLYQNYASFLEQDSNSFLSLLTVYIDKVVSVIERFLLIIASIFILIAIIVSLLIVDFKLTITLFGTIFIIYNLIGKFVSKRLYSNSKKEIEYDSNKISILREGINSIREILINNRQEFFLNNFKNSESKLQSIKADTKIISIFPKPILEALGLTTISLTVLILSLSSESYDSLIPVIGTISLASIRLLNSVQSIYAYWSSILASTVSIKEVTELLNQNKKNYLSTVILSKNKSVKFSNIEFINVSYKYPKTKMNTISNFNCKLSKGEKIGIVGKTGSGKSTFIDLFAGLLSPTKGSILINNKYKQTEKFIPIWQKNISYLSQFLYISNRSLIENVAFGIDINLIDIKKVKEVCKIALIDEFIDLNDKYDLNKSLGEAGVKLSGGQRQRIALARALYKNSDILILDEATSALDLGTEKLVMKNLLTYYKDLTILMISHRISVLNKFDKIYELSNGNFKSLHTS